jgi:uncharacterized protein YjbI with pentapeptide repeats
MGPAAPAALGAGPQTVRASRLAAPQRRLGRFIRYLLVAFALPVIFVAVFAAGLSAYAAARIWSEWLLFLLPGLLAVLAGVVAFGTWWLWWRLPKRQADQLSAAITDAKARADVEDNFRKTAGQLLGGAAVLIGAGFAYVQFTQQQTSAHDLLISGQVSKGFDQLGQGGSDKITIRLGGIYALEGVMNTSEQYHQPVLETLCAFVRDSTKDKTDNGPPAADVQAALTVIGRRSTPGGRVDLHGAHIRGADVTNADLSGADLHDTDLSGAKLTVADLHDANLSNANLSGAELIRTDLGSALMPNAGLNDANLSGADLSGAYLEEGEVRDPSGFRHLPSAYLTNANLRGVRLIDADLSGVDLNGAKGLTQEQLNTACGTGVKGINRLDPPLTFHDKPCPEQH